VAGDSAHRDKDGYFWIMGRIDDVLNVAGHRLGTMEIESALVAHPKVAEAAVVGKPHDIKGESVFCFVVLKGERPAGEKAAAFTKALRDHVAEQLGAIAKPDEIRFTENLPKTRSGKIMRRLLRAIARNEDITQDLSTLENPAIIDQLRGNEPAAPAKPTARPAAPKKPARVKKPAKKRKVATRKQTPKKSAAPRKKKGFLGKLARKAKKVATRKFAKRPAKAGKGKKTAKPAKRAAKSSRGKAARKK
jgi:hypothetical protein